MQLTNKQFCLLTGAALPLTKVILVPALFATYAKNDLWIPALLFVLLEGGVLLSTVLLAKGTDKTFYMLLSDTFGETAARVIFGFFGVYLLFVALLPILEQYLLLRSAYYDALPSQLLYIPFFLAAGYFAMKSFKAFGRIAELVVPVSLISLVVIGAMSLGKGDYSLFTPVFSAPFSDSVKGMFTAGSRTLVWFADAIYPLFFLGKFRYEKGLALKSMIAWAVSSLLLLLFLVQFYAVYSVLSPRQSSAISRIGQYFSGVGTLGRVDYIFVYLFSSGTLTAIFLPIFLSVECFQQAFALRADRRIFTVLAVCGVLFLIVVTLGFLASDTERFFGKWLSPLFLVVSFLLPYFAWLLRRRT
ncbi:MAG: GerAB/ArcD/ProY family transporter [Christensenellaceae bacterium]